jgi:hypothetical protein
MFSGARVGLAIRIETRAGCRASDERFPDPHLSNGVFRVGSCATGTSSISVTAEFDEILLRKL